MNYRLVCPEVYEKYFKIEMMKGFKVVKTFYFDAEDLSIFTNLNLSIDPRYVYPHENMGIMEKLEEGVFLFTEDKIKALVETIKKNNWEYFVK